MFVQTQLEEFDTSSVKLLYSSREKFARYHDTWNTELAKLGYTRILHLLDTSREVLQDHCVSMQTSKEVN